MAEITKDILQRALEREKAARKQAEQILENKSKELYMLAQELKSTNKQLEDLLSKKDNELKGVFHNLVDAYILMDIYGNVLEMNTSAENLFGYDIRKEPLNVVPLIHKEDIKYAMNSFKELIHKGAFTNYQARVYTKNKGIRTVHINASTVVNNEGRVVAAQGIVRDITDDIIQRNSFEEHKKQLYIIVENSPLGIILTDGERIINCNKAFLNQLGYTKKEIKKLRTIDISDKLEYENTKNDIAELNAGIRDQLMVKKKYYRKDGSYFWAKTNLSSIKDHKGNVRYQVAIIEDITNELRHERRQQELLKKLEQSNKELNDFAHIVSHDLKSPLRSMNALINWMKEDYEDQLDEEAQVSFDSLLKKIEKMDSLIGGILQYSSIDNQKIEEKEIDLNKVIYDIIEMIYIPDSFTIKIEDQLPYIKGDKYRFQQLFQNLISNAIKYNDKEKGELCINCKESEDYWQFTFADNGPGIPKNYHKKIFEIFQTVGNCEDSTGVGLSIVKKVVNMYGGTVDVSSTPGKGTTFSFTLKKT